MMVLGLLAIYVKKHFMIKICSNGIFKKFTKNQGSLVVTIVPLTGGVLGEALRFMDAPGDSEELDPLSRLGVGFGLWFPLLTSGRTSWSFNRSILAIPLLSHDKSWTWPAAERLHTSSSACEVNMGLVKFLQSFSVK